MSGPRPIVLIGLSGAGKTTVARHLAELLGTAWCDLDSCIAERAGMSIAQIFAEQGEMGFRTMEHAELQRQLAGVPRVIAAGAGWAAQPGAIASVTGQALVIHLQVSVAVAVRRLRGTTDRPLLAGDLEAALTAQAEERLPLYRLADLEIAADSGSPDVIAAGVASAARQYGGWASR